MIEGQGLEALTTARIAEVAGYGVGTVYDYFPTKNAILVALARQELDKTVAAVQRALRQADAEGPCNRDAKGNPRHDPRFRGGGGVCGALYWAS